MSVSRSLATSTLPVALRPVADGTDEALADEVAAVVRAEQFAGLDPTLVQTLTDFQVRAQRSAYRDARPHSRDGLIERDGVPVGRCWVDRSGADVHVLDLAVLPQQRRAGVARQVLADLQAEAATHRQRVTLAVREENEAARALYRGLGFTVAGGADGVLELAWEPESGDE